MKWLLPAIVGLCLLSVVREVQGQVLPLTHYTTDSELNPLPSAEVTQVYQDRIGFMWFAIYSSGLVRYNGVEMEQYGIKDGLRDITVWDMVEGSTGRLWVSSNAGLVVTQKPLSSYATGEKITFLSEVSGVPLINASVNHNRMAVDNYGWLWVGTESMGIVRYRFGENNILESDTLSTIYSGSKTEIPVRSLTARKDGSVWAGSYRGVLLKYKKGEFIQAYSTGSRQNTNTLYEAPDGALWGGEQNGTVWKMVSDNANPSFKQINSSSNDNVVDITADSEGDIWISSEGSGLQKIEKGNEESILSYSRSNGLLSEIIYNLYEDRERNLWIAQSGGLSKLRYNHEAFTNISATSVTGEKPILPSPAINAVLPVESVSDHDPCSIWAGTAEGGLACISHNFDSQIINQEGGLSGNWVNGLAYDSSGRLWIGTTRGLNSITFGDNKPLAGAISEKDISVLNSSALLSGYKVSSILAINNLQLPATKQNRETVASTWLPAYQAVYVIANDQLFTLDRSWDLPVVIFHAAAFDNQGHLWLGTRDQGIYRSSVPISLNMLENGRPSGLAAPLFQQIYSTENGFPTNQIDNLLWHKGKMWAGTPFGLLGLSTDPFDIEQHLNEDDGLPANNVTSLALSPLSKTLWIGTNQGLAEINPETGTVLKKVTKADGLIDNEAWFYGSLQVTSQGIVYFGSAKGVSVYRPAKDFKNSHPPVVKLTSVRSEDVPGERNEFSFEYAALSFGNERQVRYQTRLIGFNNEWSAATEEVKANYTNLPAYFFPKMYTFQVRAVNESGLWSDQELSYNFSVTPPAWLKWWAFLGYFISFGLVIFFIDRTQRSRLIKKEREAALLRETELQAETAIARSKTAEAQAKALKAENELKSAELEKARELGKAYHKLKTTQKKLIQAEKMASLGRLSTGIAHEIKNPLNFINNFAELSTELVNELKEAIDNNDTSEVELITTNLSFNTKKIEEHGKRADSIVRSMMQHSAGSNSKFELENLNNLVDQYTDLAFHSYASKFENGEVAITKHLDPNLPPVNIISRQIGQAIQNIIENAFDAVWNKSSTNGTAYQPEIEISTRRINEVAEICISDNGAGIPEAEQEKIFEPFYTTKPTGEGTGLGLSICYDIITQMHNGSLKVQGGPHDKTSFIITLPLPKHAAKND